MFAKIGEINQVGFFQMPSKPNPAVSQSPSRGSSSPLLPTFPREIRIEDGKLFYEKRWFRRGQSVQVDAKSGEKFPAMISAIGSFTLYSFYSLSDFLFNYFLVSGSIY